ncbi:MAG TPA: PAS domain S-box protein [Terriglobia bacterium]|nr:PAS domain S-box protein [Terriglobia bacterium]
MRNTASQQSDPLDLPNVIETIPALVVCALPDGSVEFVNRAWQEYTGYSPQYLTGSLWQMTIHPDDLAEFMDEWTVALSAGKPFEIEARVRRADGEYRWFLVKKALAVLPSRDSEPSLRTLVALEDINEEKQARAKLQQSEARYRVLVETASDAVISADESGIILFANPSTARIFGYDPTELIGKPLTVLMPEFLRRSHENGFGRYLSAGRRHVNWQGMEVIGLRKNGQEFPIEVSLGELIRDGHRVFTGFIRDISQKRRAEEAWKEAQQALQTSEAELSRVSRLTTMGELAASIAHEVNQPLAAVTNNANACLRLLANGKLAPEVLRRALEEIVADGTRASAVIARIRAFIKKTPPEKNELDVNEVIQEVLALAGRELHKNGVVIECRLAKALPRVMGDRVQLQQVLLNLIRNAIEAMAAVTDRSRSLWVQSRTGESGDLRVEVRDSGPGLGQEAARLFTPFFTTKANGMGMGLSISRSIIEDHGGRLWAAANSPHGAVFFFALPAAAGSRS